MRIWVLLLLMINLLFADINLNDRLKEFTEDFKSKRNEKKYFTEISELSVEKQRELLNRYDATVKIINPDDIPEWKQSKALQKSLNNNVKYIIKFYDAIHSWTPNAEKNAIKHESKVPELQWTQIMQIERQEWQIADIKATFELAKERLKWKWLDKEIASLDKNIASLDKNIAKHKADLDKSKADLDKTLKELQELLKK